jgi:hypothetical protein
MTLNSSDSPNKLQAWISQQAVGDEMLWKSAWGHQVSFVRDDLVGLVGAGLDYDDTHAIPNVISTHVSKSILLPVYELSRPDLGLRLILRNNFHDWKLSVISEKPIDADFSGLFYTTPPVDPDYTGDSLHAVYFEGFPRNLVFGYYDAEKSDRCKWSAEIYGDQSLWTTLFLIMRSLGAIKLRVWSTAEGARKARDEARKAKS